MAEHVTLRNSTTGKECTLGLLFTEQEYADALENLGVAFDPTYLLVDNMPPEIEIVEHETYIPLYSNADAFKDVVLLNFCVKAYGDAEFGVGVDAYIDDIGVNGGVEFINLCMNSEDVCLYWWDEGTYYEGFGHYLLDGTGQVPDFLEYYIDYDEYGRNNDECVYVHENFGHFPEDGRFPDLDSFDIDDLYDELEWDIEYEPVAKRTVNINDDALFKFL